MTYYLTSITDHNPYSVSKNQCSTNKLLVVLLKNASKMKGILSNTGGSPDFRMPRRSESKCLSSIRCMNGIKIHGVQDPKVGNSQKKQNLGFICFFWNSHYLDLKSITFRLQKIGSWNDACSRNPITKSRFSSLSITSLRWILLKPHDCIPRIPANCDGVSGTRMILSMLNLSLKCDWFTRPNFFGCELQIVTDVLEYAWF